jgi:aminopeptidase N
VPDPKRSLTHTEAIARAELLHVSRYDIDLDLTGARELTYFTSTTRVRFTCRAPGAQSFVELMAASILELVLNGQAVDPVRLEGNRIVLTDLLADNELIVRAQLPYSNTGEGIHKFTDPEDGEVYLYAQAGPDDAQRIFACFDQPDLKAPIALTASAPPGWIVRANGVGHQTADGSWEFAPTPAISTYLMTIVAGPYHLIEDRHDGIDLGLLCRRSLAPHLDKDVPEILEITRGCFDRYHEMFSIRYPFGKYDQAFVPELNLGAMENPGCVTFRDEFLFRSAVTDADREQRAIVIAHEMAHMWFGNLVTLRWWDDIWLNESFAEHMGWRLTAETTRFTGAWTSFALGRKAGGYAADQRPSTHPVAAEEVVDTAQAQLNFDGISYAKGAAVLRQLVAWMGDDAFLTGLRTYFTRHAYGNATLADLLAALTETSGKDLHHWADVWLRQPQVNTLRPEVVLAPDGRYQQVAVIQTAPPAHPTLRPHRINVGVYGGHDAATHLRTVGVDLDPMVDGGRTPVTDLAGTLPGRLLLLNDGDLTFAKVRLDATSRTELLHVLPALEDSLARAVVWGAAVDATRDAEWPATEFVALAAAGLQAETEPAVFEAVIDFAANVAARQYLDPAARSDALATLAAACAQVIASVGPGSRQLAAVRGLVMCAGPADVGTLTGWLTDHDVPAGLAVDAELRWLLLNRLVVLGAAGDAEITQERRRDPSAQGAEHAAGCRAAMPTVDAKARAWQVMINDDEQSMRFLEAAAANFWHPEQHELTAQYVARYFSEAPQMAARRTPNVAAYVAMLGYPRYAISADTLAAAEAMLARDDLEPALRRTAVDATDELSRAWTARNHSTQGPHQEHDHSRSP